MGSDPLVGRFVPRKGRRWRKSLGHHQRVGGEGECAFCVGDSQLIATDSEQHRKEDRIGVDERCLDSHVGFGREPSRQDSWKRDERQFPIQGRIHTFRPT